MLLSVLVFPGAGHLYLKRYKLGALLVLLSLLSIISILTAIIRLLRPIVREMALQGGGLDIQQVSQLVSDALANGADATITLTLIGLAVLWVFSLIDSYRLSKKK